MDHSFTCNYTNACLDFILLHDSFFRANRNHLKKFAPFLEANLYRKIPIVTILSYLSRHFVAIMLKFGLKERT